MKSQLHLSAWWQQIVNWYFLMLQTSACTHRCREGVENTKSDVHIDILCARTHAVRTHTRGRGDLIKCRQRLWTGLQWSRVSSCHSNSSSRPIRCRIKAGAATEQWVHRRYCCVRGQQSAMSPAGICRRRSCRESHLTTASTAEACLHAVWSSPNVYVMEPQASGMEVMRC